MVYVILTRQAIASLADKFVDGSTVIYMNAGVLTDEELARMRADGIAVNVLPRAVDINAPFEIDEVVQALRHTHGETIWVEHPFTSSETERNGDRSPEPVQQERPLMQTLLALSQQARATTSWTFHRLKRLSDTDGTVMVIPYMGFGVADRFVLQGRVIKDEGFHPPNKTRSAWSNFFELYKRIDSSEIPGVKVIARFQDIEHETVTNSAGYFHVEFRLSEPLKNSGWHKVELRLGSPALQSGKAPPVYAQVLVPPSTARFGVISDIDDTVLWSNVTNKVRMLKMLAMTNAYTRKPFRGVTAFYCALRDGIGGDEGNPIFYVSSSPWHLYTPLVDFLQAQGIPLGPLMLKELGVKHLFGRDRHHGHKLGNIEKILQTYPGLPFILIGDSGQHDPEIYQEVVKRYPDRIRAIYIRNVNPDPERIEALDRLIEEVRSTGTQLLLIPDSEAAAAHAAAEGLIDPHGMQQVRTDKKNDSGLLLNQG
ncbi:App1 family protein [Noviherbaspirillum aerium]|uniref:App1 family protein n=1 Tax=Noviherbaspirillum aerium TaxID=2588497 RepID=UPI00124D60FB|nr:phosphatase domain-containing protein [Noviherbaspirillum aerium]